MDRISSGFTGLNLVHPEKILFILSIFDLGLMLC